MDKRILDELIKFGLVTNINVDHNKYKDVDDLINKGIITIPGAKDTINKLIKNIGITSEPEMTSEVLKSDDKEIITDAPISSPEVIVDTPEQVSPIVDTMPDEKPLDEVEEEPVEVVETSNEEPTVEVVEPLDEVKEEPQEIVVDEVKEESVEETTKKKKTKKSE